jgi:YebC/PmpR family DNA-binding regulatory protein
MSGHSKWSTIKRKKGALDAKRSKIFSKIVKEIQVAVKESGPDPEANPRLRLAIANAKGQNMPKDNMERAISKADKDGGNLQETTFEGYGPGGVAIFVECLTDNNNRTVSVMRSIFTKRGGSLGKNGSVAFVFDRKGVFTVPKKADIDPDELELELIDAGAEELESEEDAYIITCALEDFGNIQKKLDQLGIEAQEAKLERVPNNTTKLPVEEAKKFLNMVEDFEDDDDVQNVFHNLEMTDELEKALAEE